MIVTFKSSASGDVIMFGDVAQRMMEIMGKAPGNTGIVTAEQLPGAIEALRAAIAADKAQQKNSNSDDEDTRSPQGRAITLSQRAVPLLELLEWSLKRKVPVTWGV